MIGYIHTVQEKYMTAINIKSRSKSVMPGEYGTVSNRPSSPNTLERPLKTGWLKKKRSLVKQWQSRWFVLRGDNLCYYKEEEDGRPQGCILLKENKVNEVPPNPEYPGKFLFEITPGGYSDQDRIGSVYETYLLMANSQNEMKEWVKAIRRTMGTASGAVFGQRLVDTMVYEQKFGKHLVPMIVEQCADFIREHGLNEEGVFRLPGQDNQVKELRDAFDSGERPTFDRDTDVHTVASLFKLYLRELPEPVIPWSQYDDFLACSQRMNINEEEGRQELMSQVSFLPQTGTPQIQKLMTILISKHDELFPKLEDKPPSPLRTSVQRSMVGWGAADLATGTAAHAPCGHDGNASSTSKNELENCPRQRTQTLPSRKCTEVSHAAKGDISSSQPWSASGSQVGKCKESIPEGHRRCLSQDVWKVSDSSQRLSTSDNSPTSPAASSPWGKDGTAAASPSASPDTGNPLALTNPSLPAKIQEAEGKLGSAAGGSGVPSQEEPQGDVDELRRRLNTEKKDYEERIDSLEKENYEVWSKLLRLNKRVEEDKKLFEDLEGRLQNALQAQANAERRNKELEEELKNFFQQTQKKI
ncbi:hypothetical protein scyTo_0015162 [Scyliorhinus torazame]|uniref:Rho GTPase-activating protein 25 n=1 Tax=Scyliorhinus torazame TaxID=75743 RepID=A0A401P3U6_SCYTO|nr:hypothetical protein [Scyliorhinus torazame]